MDTQQSHGGYDQISNGPVTGASPLEKKPVSRFKASRMSAAASLPSSGSASETSPPGASKAFSGKIVER